MLPKQAPSFVGEDQEEQHKRPLRWRFMMLQNAGFGNMREDLRPRFVAPSGETGDGEPLGQVPLLLQLKITDPEISAALRAHSEGEPRDQYALGALRLGVLALRAA